MDGSIGPVALVLESEAMFFVTPITAEEEADKEFFTLKHHHRQIAGIARGVVKAVAYSPTDTLSNLAINDSQRVRSCRRPILCHGCAIQK